MKKYKLSILWALVLCSSFLQAQNNHFQHSIGFSFQELTTQPLRYLYLSNTQPPFYRKLQNESKNYGTLSYHARQKIWAVDSSFFDFSLDLPLELSLFWSSDETSVDNFVNLSLPIIITANYGAYTLGNQGDTPPVGIFGGGGILWQYTDGNLGYRKNFSPYILLGLRFDFKKRFGLEISYGQNLFLSEIQREEAGDPWFTPEFFHFNDIKLQSRSYSARLIF